VNSHNQHKVLFKFCAAALVLLALTILISRDTVSWIHQLSHHADIEHPHHDHHHCGDSTVAHEFDKCKPEICEHEAHLSAEAEPCFWCSLPLSSIYAEDILKNVSSTLFKTESAFLIYRSFFYSELKSPASNRGPPCSVFLS